MATTAAARGQAEVTAAAPTPTTKLATDETTGVAAVKPIVVVRKLGFTVLSDGGAAPIAEWVDSASELHPVADRVPKTIALS